MGYQERWRWTGGVGIGLAVGLVAATLPVQFRGWIFATGIILLLLGFYVTLAPGTRLWRQSHLRIVEALWGPPESQVNVADKLNDLITNGALHTRANIGVLGDHAPGKGKYLRLTYEAWGKVHRIDLHELDAIDVP